MQSDDNYICLDGIIFGLQRTGGISNYWGRLLEGYSILEEENFRTVVPRGVKYLDYKTSWKLGNTNIEALSPSITRYLSCTTEKSDSVLHTSYYRMPSRPIKRYVVTVYDFTYERYRSGLALWVHATQKRRSIERADFVACISSYTRDEVLEFCPNVDPLRLKVIPLAVDAGAFYPDRQALDSELENTVLFVGVRGGYKRFDLAVAAVKAVSRLRLGFVGPALTPEEVSDLNARLPDRWHYLGTVTARRLRELYSSVYALIFPSDCEGFGLPVLEAMACGCPVVAAHRTSLPEVGGDAALYAACQHYEDYADALKQLDSVERRAQTVGAGLLRIREFTWEKTVQLTRELYQK